MQDSLKASTIKCNDLKDKNQTLEQKIDELNESITTNKEDIEATTCSYKQLLQEITPIQQQNKELTVQYDIITRAYQETRDELDQLKQSSSDEINNLQQEINTKSQELTQQTIDINDLTQKWRSSQSQNKNLIRVKMIYINIIITHNHSKMFRLFHYFFVPFLMQNLIIFLFLVSLIHVLEQLTILVLYQ